MVEKKKKETNLKLINDRVKMRECQHVFVSRLNPLPLLILFFVAINRKTRHQLLIIRHPAQLAQINGNRRVRVRAK